MDATQAINDSILESDEEQNEEQDYSKRGRPLAKLCILKNPHIPETELPLFLGDNVLGRDPSICTLPLTASSVSKQHATICISVFRRRGCHSEVDTEALVWDLGSMNGTRKGRLKLTPNVRYALSEGDSLVLADIPCQYVSCGADSVSSQDDMRTSGSRSSRVKAMLPDASGGKLGDTDTGSKKCVNGGEKAKKTPVRGGCLSFEQTPTQPQGSLVSESDSDSETGGREDRRQKIRVSDSDSHKSSPTSSTFFSPLNKIVPESEDESPLTPSSSTRSNRHVSFSTEKAGDDVETNKSPTCVEISEEEEGRGPQGGTHSEESGHHAKPKGNMSFTGSALSTPEVSRDAIPEFNMDSDTDVEGEVAPAGTLNQQVHQPLTVQFHMDSDTDEDISDKPPKTGPISNDTTKPSSSIQPECIIMNSDTDDDVSDSVTAAKASSFHGAPTADSAPSMQPSDFHLDSDTDVDEDDDGGCGIKSENSQTDETLIKAESGVVVHGSSASPHNLHSNANTGRADVCSRAAADPSVASALTESCVAAAAGADLDILSDSDTDEEDDSLQVIPAAVTNLSGISGKTSDPLKSDSGTDVDEPCVPRAGDNQADPEVESDTDVEDVEADVDKSPHLQREQTLRSLVLPQQNCSTPIRVSERKVEDMDTQAFTSPSSGAFRRAEAPIMSCSDSQDDEDYAVAETQSFVLQTRDQQTGVNPNPAPALEDRSHLQCHGSALENIQAHASDEGGVSLEETQAYEAMSAPENDSDLEATQAYAEDEEPVRDSRVSEKESCVNLAFEATQVYISESYSDSEGDSDKRQNTDPTGSLFTLATAETQPVTSFEEDNLNIVDPICSVQHAKPRLKSETEEKEAAQPQEPHAAEAGSIAETQPMCASDDEDLLNPPELKEEQRQLQTCSSSSLAATQPMDISMDETQPMVLCENEDEDSMPLLRKRKAKQLHTDEEELTNSDVCTAETQPIVKSESDDDDDSMPGPRKRKAKPLQLEDETQSLVNSDVSAVESQPATTGEGEQRDKPRRPQTGSEVSGVRTHPEVRAEEENKSEVLVIPRKRKAKQLHIEDEESQQIIKSECSVTETQPTCEIKHEEEETKPPITTEVSDVKIQSNKDDESQTRSAKQQHLKDEEAEPISQSDDSPGETSMKTTTDGTKKLQVPNSRRTRARFREEEAECSAAPKTQTKKESKTPATRGRRGKAMTRDENSEEEGKQSKQEDEEQQRTEETENERVATDDRGRKQEEVEEELENEERLQVEDAAWKELDREKKEQEHQTRLKEEKQVSQKNKGEEEMLNIPARGRRATRKTAEPQQNSVVSTEEDVPARRTRSRSNSSNSVSSERSASRVNAQESKGRGRGRGAKRTSETLQTTRNTRRRVTVAAGLTEQDGSNSSISVSSSISRQTGDELQGRARRTRSDRHVVAPDVSDRSSTARGRKSGKMVASSSELRQENDTKKANARQATTSRGQQQVNSSTSQPALRQDEGQLSQDKSLVDETTPLSKRNVKVKGQKVENLDKPVASSVSDGDAACSKRKGRTSELETHTEANSVSTGTNRVQKTTEEESKDEPKQEIPANIQFRRTSRASSTQVKKNIKESPSEKEVGAAERKTRGRNSAVQRNKKEEDADVEASEQPKTPRSHVSRKRQASSDSSPLAKTPRSSSCSPTASVRLRAGKQPYKVLFTGVVDEAGQEVLAQLGGSMAKGVADMNCLVTDKVRRTVKFLCAVAKGVPVVTTDWLEKSGKAGSFLSPNAFIVKDPDQEKKFSFCLQESLRTARTQPLLQGYEIHVTKSVKPEPVHMKDIISCSGATFLPKMPSSHKPQTVVISCEEDRRLCGPAVSASLPVVTAEFILTGILQQQLDFQTHALSPPPSSDSQPSGDRGRSRRKI